MLDAQCGYGVVQCGDGWRGVVKYGAVYCNVLKGVVTSVTNDVLELVAMSYATPTASPWNECVSLVYVCVSCLCVCVFYALVYTIHHV